MKLLAYFEQRNQAQAGYIQQLEEALKNVRQWRFGRKSEAFQGEQRGLFDEDIEQQQVTLLPEPKAPKQHLAKRHPLPFYRQQAIYQCSGVDLPRSTLAGWCGAVGLYHRAKR